MSVFTLLFEGLVAALMVALIIYCVRLDRRLAMLRENDAGIRAMIEELQASATRAEAASARLKAAGLEAEQSLAQAIRTAQSVQDGLVRLGRAAPAAAPAAVRSPPHAETAMSRSGGSVPPPAHAFDSDRGPVAPRGGSRSEAEEALLNAIRVARAAES